MKYIVEILGKKNLFNNKSINCAIFRIFRILTILL